MSSTLFLSLLLGFTCICTAPYLGLNCELNSGSPCKIGLYRASEQCVPCVCDREGTTSNICSRRGVCECNVSLLPYEVYVYVFVRNLFYVN